MLKPYIMKVLKRRIYNAGESTFN